MRYSGVRTDSKSQSGKDISLGAAKPTNPLKHPLVKKSPWICIILRDEYESPESGIPDQSGTFSSLDLFMRFMRSIHPPRRPSSPPRRLSPPDKHFLHFFCPFVVHYPYPLICDSTITDRSNAVVVVFLCLFCCQRFLLTLHLNACFHITFSWLCVAEWPTIR